MNYARIRNKLKEKQKDLSKMSGADRTKLEEHIISEASKEQEPKKEVQGNKNANRRN